MKSKNATKDIMVDRIFNAGNNLFLFIAFLIVLYPLIYVVSCSFSSTTAVLTGRVRLFPVDFSLKGYQAVFSTNSVLIGYRNTIFYTFFGTIFNLALTVLAAYPLSRKDFYARNAIMFFFAFTMFFSGGMIPSYLLVKSLGLVNKPIVMIVLGGVSVYNVIVTRTFMESNIPFELYEAAEIDGCSDIRFMFAILLPLSQAVLAVMVLFYAVGHWNSFFNGLLYLSDKEYYPLQLVLREILIVNSIDPAMTASIPLVEQEAKGGLAELLKYSLIVVASVPVLIIYPFVQKYFLKGVMIGSIKG